jgi:hypothetical protein
MLILRFAQFRVHDVVALLFALFQLDCHCTALAFPLWLLCNFLCLLRSEVVDVDHVLMCSVFSLTQHGKRFVFEQLRKVVLLLHIEGLLDFLLLEEHFEVPVVPDIVLVHYVYGFLAGNRVVGLLLFVVLFFLAEVLFLLHFSKHSLPLLSRFGFRYGSCKLLLYLLLGLLYFLLLKLQFTLFNRYQLMGVS